jgi:hypothetical protein
MAQVHPVQVGKHAVPVAVNNERVKGGSIIVR